MDEEDSNTDSLTVESLGVTAAVGRSTPIMTWAPGVLGAVMVTV